jgi:hypothetical protein
MYSVGLPGLSGFLYEAQDFFNRNTALWTWASVILMLVLVVVTAMSENGLQLAADGIVGSLLAIALTMNAQVGGSFVTALVLWFLVSTIVGLARDRWAVLGVAISLLRRERADWHELEYTGSGYFVIFMWVMMPFFLLLALAGTLSGRTKITL